MNRFTSYPYNSALLEKLQNNEQQNLQKVREWVLEELIHTYHFPQKHVGYQIKLLGKNSQLTDNFYGILVESIHRIPFLLISIVKPDANRESVLREILKDNPYIGLCISTDGTREGSFFYRRRFDNDKLEFIQDIEANRDYKNSSVLLGEEIGNDHAVRKQKIISEKVENIFFEIHSIIRDIDGLHADEALDELCKIIYAKLYDEEMTEKGKPFKLQRWLYGSTEEFAAEIRALYECANNYDVRVYGLKIPEYSRSRGVFDIPMRLTSPALTKAVEALQEYNLTKSPLDIKGRAFQNVLSPAVRSGMGQYFTPDPIVRMMSKIANPQVSELILDPFCGSAHFLTACLDIISKSNVEPTKKLNEFVFYKLHGIEKSDRMVRIAMTDMRLHGDGHSNIRCTDSLLDLSNYQDLYPESFDLILTNPPFGSLLGQEALTRLGEFQLSNNHKNVPLEIIGLERCMQFLRPGGRLGIVLPDGLLVNKGSRYVREWVEKFAKLRAIISLPIETFSPFGANVKTSILFLRKWNIGENKNENYNIYLSRVDNVGYDPSGKKREGSDIDKVTEGATHFLRSEGW